jgi:hypothetical protein
MKRKISKRDVVNFAYKAGVHPLVYWTTSRCVEALVNKIRLEVTADGKYPEPSFARLVSWAEEKGIPGLWRILLEKELGSDGYFLKGSRAKDFEEVLAEADPDLLEHYKMVRARENIGVKPIEFWTKERIIAALPRAFESGERSRRGVTWNSPIILHEERLAALLAWAESADLKTLVEKFLDKWCGSTGFCVRVCYHDVDNILENENVSLYNMYDILKHHDFTSRDEWEAWRKSEDAKGGAE